MTAAKIQMPTVTYFRCFTISDDLSIPERESSADKTGSSAIMPKVRQNLTTRSRYSLALIVELIEAGVNDASILTRCGTRNRKDRIEPA